MLVSVVSLSTWSHGALNVGVLVCGYVGCGVGDPRHIGNDVDVLHCLEPGQDGVERDQTLDLSLHNEQSRKNPFGAKGEKEEKEGEKKGESLTLDATPWKLEYMSLVTSSQLLGEIT